MTNQNLNEAYLAYISKEFIGTTTDICRKYKVDKNDLF